MSSSSPTSVDPVLTEDEQAGLTTIWPHYDSNRRRIFDRPHEGEALATMTPNEESR